MLRKKALLHYGLFTLGGAGIGYLYYVFFGCTTGCPITSNLGYTVSYMAVVGLLVGMLFEKEPK